MVDSRRGLLYPLVLRAAHGLVGGSWEEGLELEESAALPKNAIRCWAPAWQMGAQIIQLTAFLGALLYALNVFRPSFARGKFRSALLIGAIFLDPFLIHSQLALMPDGPAVSACVVFVAGWVEFTRDRRARGAIALALGALLAAGFRPEKGIVLLVAAVAAAVLSSSLKNRPPRLRSRVLIGASIAVLVWIGTAFAGIRIQASSQVFSLSETVTHTRIVYPRLERLHPLLPDHLKEQISLKLARRYDKSASSSRVCIQKLSGGDPALRASLTSELRSLALREMGGEILWDCTTDTVQNLFPVPSFLVRWHLWNRKGAESALIGLRQWESLVVWGMLSYHEPGWSRFAIQMTALCMLVSAVLGLSRLFASRKAWSFDSSTLLTWSPVFLLMVANAGAFAFTQDLFEVRYVYFSHLLLVSFLFTGLGAFLGNERRSD